MRYDRLRYDSIEQLPFDLVGEFLGFVWDKRDQPRALRLIWLGREIVIKVSKSLRADRYDGWIPGMQVEVWGQQKFSKKKAKLKLNADRIAVKEKAPSLLPTLITAEIPQPIMPQPIVPQSPQPSTKPPTIKVCGKSDCMKRGGKAMCKTLGKALQSGDYPTIEVQFTGCMGKCSQGPNLVVMPDKKRYTKVTAHDIPQVLAHHFSGKS
jgi:(2Fe-2S) ferredoxin